MIGDAPKSGSPERMREKDYPGLFQAADSASNAAQATYLGLQKWYLSSLVTGSVIGASTAVAGESARRWLYSASAIFLIVGLLLLWIARARRDDRVWFDCRAIAESVKTATWRFMMGVPPFDMNEGVDETFVSQIREIRAARTSAAHGLARHMEGDTTTITDFMNEMRRRSFEGRKAFFFVERLQDQKNWYSSQARRNADEGSKWFRITVGLQGLAAVIAIVQAVLAGPTIAMVSVATTAAAAVAAWSSVKGFGELSQAYAVANQELSELESIAAGVDERRFAQWVEQIEDTVSREHTMWYARRDIRL